MQTASEKTLIYKKWLLAFNFEVWKQTYLGKIDMLEDHRGMIRGTSHE